MTLRALDLFCGAGGASMGLHRAGFEVVGIDHRKQPRYPFTFIQADALRPPVRLEDFDLIWASPPCQAFCAYRRRGDGVGDGYENLIPETRAMLSAAGVPYVIENVPGAPLEQSFKLCGSSFGLNVRRHRLFEASFRVLLSPPCAHGWQLPRFQQATNRTNQRRTVEVGVYRIPLETQRAAMGIDWMRLDELSQAIPPAYAEFIGRAARQYINGSEKAA
jgi:DNA (cytosine-5)-methyltransferase 1